MNLSGVTAARSARFDDHHWRHLRWSAYWSSMLAMGHRGAPSGDGRRTRRPRHLDYFGARGMDRAIYPRDQVPGHPCLPGIRRGTQGEPIVVFQSMVPIEGRRRVSGNRIYFPLVGITSNRDPIPTGDTLHGRPHVQSPGLHELVASNPCARQFPRALKSAIGAGFTAATGASSGTLNRGQTQQCVVYADVDGIMSTYSRNSYGSVSVLLQSPADYGVFRDGPQSQSSLAARSQARKRRDGGGIQRTETPSLNFVSYFVGTIMGNWRERWVRSTPCMRSLIRGARSWLRCARSGFGSGAIVVSILVESILWAFSRCTARGAPWHGVLFNGLFGQSFRLQFSTCGNPHRYSCLALRGALGMGLVGGLSPGVAGGASARDPRHFRAT